MVLKVQQAEVAAPGTSGLLATLVLTDIKDGGPNKRLRITLPVEHVTPHLLPRPGEGGAAGVSVCACVGGGSQTLTPKP